MGGEKLNHKSVATSFPGSLIFGKMRDPGNEVEVCCCLLLRKSQNLFLAKCQKSSEHQSSPCLFNSRFLRMFRTTPIFGMSRDHNRKRLKPRTEWIVFEI